MRHLILKYLRNVVFWTMRLPILFLIIIGFLPMEGIAQDIFKNSLWINEEITDRGNIVEDSFGFKWIGSDHGIYKYDGRRFFLFTNIIDSTDGWNIINALISSGDSLLIASEAGLSSLNTRTGKFVNYEINYAEGNKSINTGRNPRLSCLTFDSNQRLWVGSFESGLYFLEKGKLNQLPKGIEQTQRIHPTHGGPEVVFRLLPSKKYQEIVYAGTAGGLLTLNIETLERHYYTFPRTDPNKQKNINTFRRLYEHSSGLLYSGSWHGVHVFDYQSGSYHFLDLPEPQAQNLEKLAIASILPNDNSSFWITSLAGVHLYSIPEKRIIREKLNDVTKNRLYGINLIDKEGRFWFNAYNGIYVFDPALQYYSVADFGEMAGNQNLVIPFLLKSRFENTLWLCPNVSDFILEYDQSQTRFKKHTFQNLEQYNLEQIEARGFHQLDANIFLITSNQGAFLLDTRTDILLPFPIKLPTGKGSFMDITRAADGKFWIGSQGMGLVVLDWEKKETFHYPDSLFRVDKVFPVTIENVEFSGNYAFAKRNGGFSAIHLKTGKVLNFTKDNNPENTFGTIEDLKTDKNGFVWMCSDLGWVGAVDPKQVEKGLIFKKKLDFVRGKDRLWYLAADTAGNIWGTTDKELVQLDMEAPAGYARRKKYSMKSDGFFSMIQADDNKVYLGGRHALFQINLDEITTTVALPVPYITGIKARQEKKSLIYNKDHGESLVLKYDENFFTIDFSAITPVTAAPIKFRYRLRDFDQWHENITTDQAVFTNVPSGEYLFELQADYADGTDWDGPILSVPVHISTAWYASVWFLTLSGLFALGMVYSVYLYRLNQFRQEQDMKMRFEKEKARSELTSLLSQMNPHFIFNSLNSIEHYILRNDPEKASHYLNKFAQLIRTILANSRKEIVALSEEIAYLQLYLEMESMRFKGKFNYQIHVENDISTEVTEIPPMLIQPFVENAIWHGLMLKEESEEKRLDLRFTKSNEQLIIQIDDNGIGREKSGQLKSQRQRHKESLGMEITGNRLRLINQLYKDQTSIQITDKYDNEGNALGTLVEIKLQLYHD